MYGVSINDNNHKSISNNKQLYAKKIQKKKNENKRTSGTNTSRFVYSI